MIEWLAMLTMLVDHLGVVFYPGVLWLRVVGRIAMPLYTWGIVRGYAHTRSLKRYALRLLVIALAAQLPYMLTAPPGAPFDLNIVFGFLAGVGLFSGLDAAPHLAERLAGRSVPALTRAIQGALLLQAFYLFWIVPVDYDTYLLALLLLYRYGKRRWVLLAGHLLLNLWFLSSVPIQMFSLIGTILLILPVRYPPLMRGRWFYRAFYPLHLAVLAAVDAVLQSW